MCPWACASGTPAVPQPPSFESSGPAAPPQCYWGPRRTSLAFPLASCCSACKKQTQPGRPRTVGTEPPGIQKSPCRLGWAGHGTPPSYTWTSPSPLSPTWSASHRYLRRKTGKWRVKENVRSCYLVEVGGHNCKQWNPISYGSVILTENKI